MAILLCLAGCAQAGEVLLDRVERQGERYAVAVDALIHARAARVRTLLTDYPTLPRLSPSIRSVVMLPRPPDAAQRMRIVTRYCVLWLCKTLTHVQEVEDGPDGSIIATVIPEQSDFRYGRMVWSIVPASGETLLKLRGELIPAFWVPPIIGPLLITRILGAEALETAASVEKLAGSP